MRIKPKKDRSPLTRLQRFAHRQEQLEKRLASDGRRIKYRNNTPGDLGLPKPAEDGRTAVGPEGEFIGDGYFLCMVPQCLIIVEDLNMKNENKLITEQPPVVTNEGRVEYVQQQKNQKLNENKPNSQHDILLNEDPVGGGIVLE
jgi:hypothetical protein